MSLSVSHTETDVPSNRRKTQGRLEAEKKPHSNNKQKQAYSLFDCDMFCCCCLFVCLLFCVCCFVQFNLWTHSAACIGSDIFRSVLVQSYGSFATILFHWPTIMFSLDLARYLDLDLY